MLKPRLQKFYERIVCEDFVLLYNFRNIEELPHFERAIFHSTSNLFASNKYSLLQSFSALFLGAGQRPMKSRAHKSIALFAIRKGNLLGLKVTLRKVALFQMLDKMLIFVIPRSFFEEKKDRSIVEHSNAFKIEGFNKNFANQKDADIFNTSNKEKIESNIRPQFINHSVKSANNFVISSKDATSFPEVSELLMFFNSLAGFSFDCSFNRSTCTVYKASSKREENVFSAKLGFALNTRFFDIKSAQKKQFISAFQYPVNLMV